MARGDGLFFATRPSPNELAIDVTGTSTDLSAGGIGVRAELTFHSPGTLVVDIDQAWFAHRISADRS